MTLLLLCLHFHDFIFPGVFCSDKWLNCLLQELPEKPSTLQQKTSTDSLNPLLWYLHQSWTVVSMICTEFWGPFWKTHLKSHFQVSINSVLAFPHSETTSKFGKVMFTLIGRSDKLKFVFSPVCAGDLWSASFGQLRNFALREVIATPWNHQYHLNVRMTLGWFLSKQIL